MLTVENLDTFLQEPDRPTDIDIAWAAGLFEGEGNINSRKVRAARRGRFNRNYTIRVRMTDEDVVNRFQSIVGGSIFLGKTPKGGPYWECHIGSKEEVRRVLTLFWPYLGERRKNKAMELGVEPYAP